MTYRPILCLDFDGVIHSYASGWKGAGVVPDAPVAGTEAFLIEATKRFDVQVFSSRSKSLAGRRAMKRYVREHFAYPLTFSPDHNHDWLYEELSFPWFKPSALITIDDRALTFTGNWADFGMDMLVSFQPWNKRRASLSPAAVMSTSPGDHPSLPDPAFSASSGTDTVGAEDLKP